MPPAKAHLRFPTRKIGLHVALALVLPFLCDLPSRAVAPRTLKVCFDSTEMFTESCGTKGTATASTLTAQQQADVIAKVQSKYDAALGAGSVMVMAGAAGANETKIIVNGGKAPGDLAGTEWGDAGQANGPGVCHEGEFTADGLTGSDLVMAIAETVAHEAGHKFGLDHNWDSPPSLMTEGSKVSTAQRKPGNRNFTADDTKKLSKNICKQAQQKDAIGPRELGTTVGEAVSPPPNVPDDQYLDAQVTWLKGGPGVEFGYIGSAQEFIFVADEASTTFLTILCGGSIDLAASDGVNVYRLSEGGGSFELSNPNPNNPQEAQRALVSFPAAGLSVQLDVIPGTTGGFHRVAVTSVPALSLAGFWALVGLLMAAGFLVLKRAKA